jgi:hypothetical protein
MKKRFIVLGAVAGVGYVGWRYRQIISQYIAEAAIILVAEENDTDASLPVPGSAEWSKQLRDLIDKDGMPQFVASVAKAARENAATAMRTLGDALDSDNADELCMQHAMPRTACSNFPHANLYPQPDNAAKQVMLINPDTNMDEKFSYRMLNALNPSDLRGMLEVNTPEATVNHYDQLKVTTSSEETQSFAVDSLWKQGILNTTKDRW